MKRNFKLACMVSLTALVSLIVSTSSIASNSNTIDAAYPVGSATYFVVQTVWSDSPPDTAVIKADRTTASYVRDIIRNNRDGTHISETPTPVGRWVHAFTVTVWSDGSLVQTSAELLNARRAHELERRIIRTEKRPRPSAFRTPTAAGKPTPAELGQYPPGCQCHARTKAGHRCKRTAKGTTGFCWQHQNQPDAFPDH